MATIPSELYPLIMAYLPSATLKICALINRALNALARPILFHSISLSGHLDTLLWQMTFFNGTKGPQVTRYIRELHLNIHSMLSTMSVSHEYIILFETIAPDLRVLTLMDEDSESMEFMASRNLLLNLIPRVTSLVSLRVEQSCLLPLGELISLCPSVCSLELVDPDTTLLQPSAHLKTELTTSSTPKFHSLILTHTQTQFLDDLTTLHLVAHFLNSAIPGMSSNIRVLALQGSYRFTKSQAPQFIDALLSPKSSFDILHEIRFPQSFYQAIDETSPPMPLSNLPTLKTIAFSIGVMTKSVSRNWSIFFTWILKALSQPHSLETLVFEVSLRAYVPVDDLMMTMDVLDGKGDSIPELVFVLIMTGVEWQEEEKCKAFIRWLERELPTLKTLRRLTIVRKWKK
ncbi:hypothetical protein DL96DRAFT_1607709 [Flagelloscypha sp. PMI_526]|nr:hypothetical protein DL96DRAFT_1607709 [Flagelloscypha sp. PMI_526]